jgi:hypothetical protein
MESTGIKRIRERVKEYDAKLRADDPRFRRSVQVIHEEGTTMYFEWAFAVKVDNCYVIFAEHHEMVIYFDDEVKVIQRGERIPVEELHID